MKNANKNLINCQLFLSTSNTFSLISHVFFFISSFFSCSNLTLFAFSFSLALWFFCDNKKQAENIPLIACVMKECHARGVHIVNDFSLALLVWIVDLFRWCRGCCQRPGTGFNVVFSVLSFSESWVYNEDAIYDMLAIVILRTRQYRLFPSNFRR